MALTRCMPCVCVAFVHAVVEYAGHPSIISVMTVTTVTNKHETTTVFLPRRIQRLFIARYVRWPDVCPSDSGRPIVCLL